MNYTTETNSRLFLFFVAVYFIAFKLGAQQADAVLLRIDKEAIKVSEFEQHYQKNAAALIDPSQHELEAYLNLFINFKLKVHAARSLGLDTLASYKTELLNYREQLMALFLKDETTVQHLVVEAYNRLKRDVNASHILIQLPPQARPADTLAAYTKISELRQRILDGASFETLALAYSEDPSVKDNKGNLGYFTAFTMVYPFENACFSTPVGSVSLPFRTQFGYHLVKVNDNRPSWGEVEVAHIMFKASEQETVIHAVYQRLMQGEDFGALAKRYSVDQNTASNGGKMAKFRAGRLVKEFEDVAFGLQEGAVSTPFQSPYGWHIVKLLKKHSLPPLSELQQELSVRVQNDQRSELISNRLGENLMKSYRYQESPQLIAKLSMPETLSDAEILFWINEQAVTVKQFKAYLAQHTTTPFPAAFVDFRNAQLIAYHKQHLEAENAEFAAVMQEYEEGLLLFEVLQRTIWDPSTQDTLGLQSFYAQRSADYRWKQRVKATILSSTSEKDIAAVYESLAAGQSVEKIKKDFTKNNQNVDVKSGIFEEESLLLPNNFEFKTGLSTVYAEGGVFKLILVDELMEAAPKSFEEAKGLLQNDFQQYLEQQWIARLKKSITVHINQKELKKLKQKYQVYH